MKCQAHFLTLTIGFLRVVQADVPVHGGGLGGFSDFVTVLSGMLLHVLDKSVLFFGGCGIFLCV